MAGSHDPMPLSHRMLNNLTETDHGFYGQPNIPISIHVHRRRIRHDMAQWMQNMVGVDMDIDEVTIPETYSADDYISPELPVKQQQAKMQRLKLKQYHMSMIFVSKRGLETGKTWIKYQIQKLRMERRRVDQLEARRALDDLVVLGDVKKPSCHVDCKVKYCEECKCGECGDCEACWKKGIKDARFFDSY